MTTVQREGGAMLSKQKKARLLIVEALEYLAKIQNREHLATPFKNLLRDIETGAIVIAKGTDDEKDSSTARNH